jgi:hypothetical protein
MQFSISLTRLRPWATFITHPTLSPTETRTWASTSTYTSDKGSETGNQLADSGAVGVPDQDIDWEHNFPAPNPHWVTGNDIFCVLYDQSDLDVIKDSQQFTITDQPM